MKIGNYMQTGIKINNLSNQYQNSINKSQQRLATGKKLASDNPAMIGRTERLKSLINTSKVTQNALSDVSLKNQVMESALSSMSEDAIDLSALAIELKGPGADNAAIEEQAKQVLDSMVETMANASYNGSNPFTDGDITITSNSGTSTFNTPKFSIAAGEEEGTYDITLQDGTELTGQTIEEILESDFIQNNLQKEISAARGTIGTNTNIIERRQNIESKNEEIMMKSLDNLESVNMDKETIAMNKNIALLEINNQLLNGATNQFAQSVGNILDIRA